MSLQAATATIVELSDAHQIIKETVVETELIQKGDIIKIAAGEQIPVDGVVLHGTSSVDESMLTGESMPVTRGVNDPVIGATINLQGQLLVKATMVAFSFFLFFFFHILTLPNSLQGWVKYNTGKNCEDGRRGPNSEG